MHNYEFFDFGKIFHTATFPALTMKNGAFTSKILTSGQGNFNETKAWSLTPVTKPYLRLSYFSSTLAVLLYLGGYTILQ